MYRVFLSPYALQTHQSTMYLRLKRVPFHLHTSSLWGTRLAGWWHRCAATFGFVSPQGKTLLTFQDVVDDCELHHPYPRMNVCSERHPQLRVASAALQLYGLWWLMNTGGLFRWVHGEGSEMAAYHASYFLLSGAPLSRAMGRTVRLQMVETLKHHGICTETENYYLHHFFRLMNALEDHLSEHKYILGTPYPTLADVTIGAAFECNFTQDDPPATDIAEGAENVMKWLRRISMRLEGEEAEEEKEEYLTAKGIHGSHKDVLPDTLTPVLTLVAEVLPWLVTQCEAAKDWYQTADKTHLASFPLPRRTIPAGGTEVGVDAGGEGGEEVLGHRVDRLLPQPWEMGFEGVSVPCQVSVSHVQQADWVASDMVKSGLILPNSAKRMSSGQQSAGNQPGERTRNDQSTVAAADTAVGDNSARQQQGAGGGETKEELISHLHTLLVGMRSSDIMRIEQLAERSGECHFLIGPK